MADLTRFNNGQGYEAKEDERAGDFDVLPAGWYPVQIDREEIKQIKSKPDVEGCYLNLMLTVQGDRFANRKLFTTVMLQYDYRGNDATKAQKAQKALEIGQRRMGALTLACGIQQLQNSEEFLGKLIDVRVKIRKGRNGYGDDNDVTEFAPIGTKSSSGASQQARQPVYQRPAAAAPSSTPAGPPKRPWE